MRKRKERQGKWERKKRRGGGEEGEGRRDRRKEGVKERKEGVAARIEILTCDLRI